MYYIHTGICYTYTFLLVRLERIIIILYHIILYYIVLCSNFEQPVFALFNTCLYSSMCSYHSHTRERKEGIVAILKRYYIPTIESVYLPSFFLLTRFGSLFTRLLIPLISRTTLKEINTRKSTD